MSGPGTAARDALLLVVDVQGRLMPAIAGGEALVATIRRLLDVAALLSVPVVYTEQNPAGLGPTVAAIAPGPEAVLRAKMVFDGWREPAIRGAVPEGRRVVVVGCEAHVCVLQTVLGLRAAGRVVSVVADAVGSRHVADRDAALARMGRHGVELVTAEMVCFEWMETADHPAFRDVVRLVK